MPPKNPDTTPPAPRTSRNMKARPREEGDEGPAPHTPAPRRPAERESAERMDGKARSTRESPNAMERDRRALSGKTDDYGGVGTA